MKSLKFRFWMPDAEFKEEDMFYQEDRYLSSFLDRIYSAYVKRHPSQLSFEVEDRLMQWSGLKDKCGMDIYDGDIVELPSYPGDGLDKYVIEFHGDCFYITDYRSTLEKYDDYTGDYYYHHGERLGENRHGVCVVGNIHENKELLNG